MVEKRTRRSFTREFKAQAVKRPLDGGKGVAEAATELGLNTGQLSTWRIHGPGARATAGERQKPGALRRELDCLLAEASVQHRGPDLEHTVCASRRPAHLPPLVHAGIHEVVDGALGP